MRILSVMAERPPERNAGAAGRPPGGDSPADLRPFLPALLPPFASPSGCLCNLYMFLCDSTECFVKFYAILDIISCKC